MRDVTLGITFYHDFTTRSFSTGVPTVLSNTPVLSVLEENNATPITAGVSLSVDRASVVGLNEATIEVTGGNGYEGGKSYSIYISTGTVGGTSVVGEIVGQFTIRQSAAAVDLANVTDGLGVLKTELDGIQTDTEDLQTQIGTAGAGLNNIGTIATCTSLTNVINAASVVASVSGNVDGNVTGSVGSNLELGPAEVNTEVDNSMITYGLDHLIQSALPTNWATDVASGSVFDNIADDGSAAFDRTTDSLQAVRDHATTIKSDSDLTATITELTQGVPLAEPNLRDAIMLLYMALRNQTKTQTSGTDALELYDTSGTMICKKLLTDAAGDYTEDKMISGT